MVRGNKSCSRFCTNCKLDCFCEAPECEHCHTCRLNHVRIHGGVFPCKSPKHDCGSQGAETPNEKMTENMLNFPKLFSSPIVEITIGKSDPEKRFVPKGALIEHAEYFKKYFDFEEKKATGSQQTKGLIVLDTDVDRPDAFDRFIQFMYWNDYRSSVDGGYSDIALHADVYVLAERLQVVGLKDLAVRKASRIAVTFSGEVVDGDNSMETDLINLECIPGVIETVYPNTPAAPELREGEPLHLMISKDPFRHIIAAFCARCLDALKGVTGFEDCVRTFPDFAVDLISELRWGEGLELDKKGYLEGYMSWVR